MSDKKDKDTSPEVDTIELGLWIRKTIAGWEPLDGMELYEYLAEEMKQKFNITIQSDCSDSDCDCDQH